MFQKSFINLEYIFSFKAKEGEDKKGLHASINSWVILNRNYSVVNGGDEA